MDILGRTLAHFEIREPLGAGGMGEVYRARDATLERDVAIKVLPADFASDPERLARFEREAKLLASLNHPNIAAVYGLEDRDGVRFIAMELVEGETLGERIGRSGRIEMAEALEIARQIAAALEAAHERGVIHRDLKPANVKIAPGGSVKVLDFGLAKALAADGSAAEISPDISNSPTVAAATRAGVILGTAAYMSPEQARGKPVDKRADIWAYGCVLYEMLCGCRPFAGETTSDTLAAVLTSAPDWSRLPAETPEPIRRLVRRSLEKNPKLRLPDIAVARLEIDEAVATPALGSAAGPPPHARGRRRLVPWGLTALFATIAAVAVWMGPPPAAPPPPERLVVGLPPGQELSLGELGVVNPVALSPDGQLLVYTAAERQTGTARLFLRPLGQFVDRPIEGTEGAKAPFFSPGGDWIGFFANEALWRVRVAGGPPVKICDTRVLFPSASWGPDDTIVFSHHTFGLYRVSASEGALEQLTVPDSAAGEVRHFAPQFLPGGGEVLFTVASDEGPAAAILSLASKDWRAVLANAESARYVRSGHLVYAQSGALRAVPFDLAGGERRGPSVPLHDSVSHLAGLGAAHFAVSDSGTLAYPPADAGAITTKLVWVDRQGQATPIVDDPAPFFAPRVSPDGRRIAVNVGSDVWVYDVERGTPTVLTTDGYNLGPVWEPSGRLTFSAVRTDPAAFFDLHSVAADRGAAPQLLLGREGRQFPSSWSPDGDVLVFFEATTAGTEEIAVLENGTVRSLLAGRSYSEYSPVFSPDGRWIAYVSHESGREEVYVTRYPGPTSSQPISVNGGREPVWSRDGRELFYRKGDLLMAVPVESAGSTLTAGSPQVLFEGRYALMSRGAVAYDVAPDGRFVMLQPLEVTSPGINVVLHFVEELKRLTPGGSEP